MQQAPTIKKSMYFLCFLCFLLPFWTHGAAGKSGLKTPAKSPVKSPVILSAVDIWGKKITTQNSRAALILFFDPSITNQKLLLSYAGILYNKYRLDGLTVIGVSKRGAGATLEMAETGNFSFPLISDPDHRIYEKFSLRNCCGGVVLLDKKGAVKFSMPSLVNKSTMRQLVEKELLGKVQYDFKRNPKEGPFKLNKTAPSLTLQTIESDKIIKVANFREDYILVTFFSTMCTTCNTGKRVHVLKNIQQELKQKHIDARSILVFFKPFDKNDIALWEKTIPMPFDKFTADDIFSGEDRYATNNSNIPDPLTVVLDKRRNVIYLETPGTVNSDLAAAVSHLFKPGKQLSKKEKL